MVRLSLELSRPVAPVRSGAVGGDLRRGIPAAALGAVLTAAQVAVVNAPGGLGGGVVGAASSAAQAAHLTAHRRAQPFGLGGMAGHHRPPAAATHR
jgi:hypothetical protein